MTVRLLRVGTPGYSLVGLAISIKAVFLAVLCPALLQRFHLRRSDYAKTTKRQYKSSNRNVRRSLLCVLVADRASHRRRPDASGEQNLELKGLNGLLPSSFCSTLFGNQRQHTGVGEKMVFSSQRRKLVTAEHADQGKITQGLAYVGSIDAGHAIERAAAGATVKIEPEGRPSAIEFLHLPLQHLIEILPRSLTVP
jgi:hypothetical protein